MMNDDPVMFPWADLTALEEDDPDMPESPELTLEEVKLALVCSSLNPLLEQQVARDHPFVKSLRLKGYPAISKRRRLKSKAAYRHNPANKQKIVAKIKECKEARRDEERAFVKRWKEGNADKVKAQKARAADRKYDNRPFVCIDSEGKFTGKTVMTNEGLAKEQRTFLWGAASTTSKPSFLCHDDKRPLSSYEICEWLCSLPRKFGKANFIGFSISYDVTQILSGLPYEKAWQIVNQLPFSEKENPTGLKPNRCKVFWDKFAISYVPRQYFSIGILRDPDRPYKRGNDGKMKYPRQIDYEPGTLITIDDVFGFYQSPFVKAAESLVQGGHAAEAELAIIREGKAKRDDFGDAPIEEIKRYTGLELSLTSRALAEVRTALKNMGVKLKGGWRGAGRIAAAIFDKENVIDNFYPEVRRDGISAAQKRAHRAFFGGRIELIRQGFHGGELHGYDIVSAYPAATHILPNMKDGTWKLHKWPCRALVAGSNILSMFLIRFSFPGYKKGTGKHLIVGGVDRGLRGETGFPFFPLPFRGPDASICYPARGMGWYMRDDVLAALEWIKTFCPNDKRLKFEIVRALEFVPANDAMPFAFIPDYFDKRAEIKTEIKASGKYNVLEKIIKLGINSIYGKTAQSIDGGSNDEPPRTANPWYAAAITAWTRRKIMEAALIDPYAIVFFATDGIISTRELVGLENVLRKGEASRLGAWEHGVAQGLIAIQSGVYSFLKLGKDGKLIDETHTRGYRPNQFYTTEKSSRQWMLDEVLPLWEKASDPANGRMFDASDYPSLVKPYRTFVTAGSACASRERWNLCGYWLYGEREINVHDPGPSKRSLNISEIDAVNVLNIAKRSRELIATVPIENSYKGFSKPRVPDWLDERIGNWSRQDNETREIMKARFGIDED